MVSKYKIRMYNRVIFFNCVYNRGETIKKKKKKRKKKIKVEMVMYFNLFNPGIIPIITTCPTPRIYTHTYTRIRI